MIYDIILNFTICGSKIVKSKLAAHHGALWPLLCERGGGLKDKIYTLPSLIVCKEQKRDKQSEHVGE